ncbi:MAG TPA: M20 aminoacylase family protein [Hyphomonas sp.]|nr:M20 aminoacylase family protein [Hyphomonas sp.]
MSAPLIGEQLVNTLSKFHEDMRTWRHRFHANPELGFEEAATSKFIASKLAEFGYEVHTGIGGTGVVGKLKCGTSNRAIGLRADMDALPVEEANGFEHKSTSQGVMHACGHDGHAASLLGAAQYLAETRNFDGTAVLIFQPAEELLTGAKAMIADGLFERFPVEAVFGYHNSPSLPVGSYSLRAGATLSGCSRFDIRIEGKGGHSAHPDKCVDPVMIACHICVALQTVVARTLPAIAAGVVSVTRIEGGDAYNVIPSEVGMAGTIRGFEAENIQLIKDSMTRIVTHVAESFGGRGEIDFFADCVPLYNDPAETDFARTVLHEIADPSLTIEMETPRMGTEDFAFMLDAAPGCYVFIGNKDETHTEMVHHPAYDYNDRILTNAAAYYARVIEKKLPSSS